MRIFRLMILLPILLCTIGAMADACWEIMTNCTNTDFCIHTGTYDDHTYHYLCGSKGCNLNTMIGVRDLDTKYYKCEESGWVEKSKEYLDENSSDIRDCGDRNASQQVSYLVYSGKTYDFYMEQHTDDSVKSDICKKPKTGAGAENNPKPVEKSKPTTTAKSVATTEQKHEESVVIEPAPPKPEQVTSPKEKAAPAATSTPAVESITISGTVFDDTNLPIPQVNIVVVGNETYGVAANDDGQYTINGLRADSKLKFSSIGFESVEKTVAELQESPKVVLKSISTELEEVTISPCNDGETWNDKTKQCVPVEQAPAELVDKIAEFVQPGLTEKQPKSSTPVSDEKKSEQDKLKSAQDALAAAREKENSWANRGVTAASSAMTGLGGMQLAEGIAEQRADAEAEKEMRAYIETMKCEYGNGQNVELGNEEITLPGGNELLDYYTEYKQLADNLKTTKSALGLRSGIESEVLYDRAQSGLYQYASIGKTGGGETSLYRALTDKESEDAVAWAEQKDAGDKKLKVGGGVAAGGVGAGLLGNAAINTDMIKNIKEVFKK